jgi:hypothetical protein
MAFLAITFSNMRTFAPIAMSAFSAMALAAVSTLAMPMLVSSATGKGASPIFGRIRPPRRECNRAPRADLGGRLVYATDSNQDLIFWMDA